MTRTWPGGFTYAGRTPAANSLRPCPTPFGTVIGGLNVLQKIAAR